MLIFTPLYRKNRIAVTFRVALLLKKFTSFWERYDIEEVVSFPLGLLLSKSMFSSWQSNLSSVGSCCTHPKHVVMPPDAVVFFFLYLLSIELASSEQSLFILRVLFPLILLSYCCYSYEIYTPFSLMQISCPSVCLSDPYWFPMFRWRILKLNKKYFCKKKTRRRQII